MAELVFGTSGWSYKEWVGPFYEKAKRMFSYYSKFFNTAEINSTFYRYPSRSMVYGWNRTAGKDFIFSAKLPRLITHEKRLDPEQGVKSDLIRFLELLEPLNATDRLGCILIQLPPSFTYDRDVENLKSFLDIIPRGYDFATEFRDYSWMRNETWEILEENNIAYCIVDEPLLPSEVHVTADFAYFRWHGRGTRPWYDYRYSEEELHEWVPKIEEVKDKVDRIYGYFNNHFHGYAVENCIEILEMLDVATPEHVNVKEKIVHFNLGKRVLIDYGFGVTEESIEGQILKLTDSRRYERGKSIRDKEIVIEKNTGSFVNARIRDYTICLDFLEKKLKHNCDDWRKGLGMKRLCKHVVKFLLTVPEEKVKMILKSLKEEKEFWIFE